MNKSQYKKLLDLRKSEEELFFMLILTEQRLSPGYKPRDLINKLPINHKRAWYLLDKWTRQGRYEYGVSLDLGWIIE